MNGKIRIATTRPHCPNCPQGHMFLMTVELETCPHVEPDVALMYQCRQCGHEIELYMSHMSESRDEWVSTGYIRKVYHERKLLRGQK